MFEQQSLLVGALFFIRLGIPLAVTALVIWVLHRLDLRWQTQADRDAATCAQATLTAQAASGSRAIIDQPCWEYKACAPAKRERCPAYHQTALHCWLARLRAEGRLPGACRCCPIFTLTTPRTHAGVAGD